MSTFFISDLHFGHKNALAFDNREFPDIETHDECLIEKWNSVVGINDEVWILGDISWYGAQRTIEIFNRLNGVKNLCVGNHDHKLLRNRDVQALFAEITDYKELEIDNQLYVLCHYPMPTFNRHYYGAVHFYGHVHVSWEYNMLKNWKYQSEALYDKPCRMYNVGCMVPEIDFTPRTAQQILELFDDAT